MTSFTVLRMGSALSASGLQARLGGYQSITTMPSGTLSTLYGHYFADRAITFSGISAMIQKLSDEH
jgi:hypothetical protein